MLQTAFDLDGVLVPDCDKIPGIGGLDDFYRLTTYMRPIFRPQGPYAIITARPAEYRPVTLEWVSKYLDPKPVRVFHEIMSDETPEQYKERIIKEYKISTYIESDPDIVRYLRENTDAKIYHLDRFIGQLWQPW
jgi:hypothetical protein